MAIAELPEVQTPVDEIDLSDFVLWSQPDAMREAVFRKLRTEKPVSFHPEPEFGEIPAGPGYWALTTYDDVTFASRHPDLFCSGQGSNIGDMPTEIAELFGSMINMDSPKHTKLRLLVNKGFTPRMVARIEDYVHDVAREIVQDIKPKGEVDFVTEVAAPMPLRIICDMMGIPRSDNEFVFDKTNHILGGLDEEYNSSIEDIFQRGVGVVGVRASPRHRTAGEPAGRHHDLAHAGRGRRRAAHRRRVRLVLRAAGGGGQRDHPQRDRARPARAEPAPPTSAPPAGRSRDGHADGGRRRSCGGRHP